MLVESLVELLGELLVEVLVSSVLILVSAELQWLDLVMGWTGDMNLKDLKSIFFTCSTF